MASAGTLEVVDKRDVMGEFPLMQTRRPDLPGDPSLRHTIYGFEANDRLVIMQPVVVLFALETYWATLTANVFSFTPRHRGGEAAIIGSPYRYEHEDERSGRVATAIEGFLREQAVDVPEFSGVEFKRVYGRASMRYYGKMLIQNTIAPIFQPPEPVE